MNTYVRNQIMRKAVAKNGDLMQQVVLIEEMSELTKEICKHYRGEDNKEKIAEELADVYIMLRQLEIIHDIKDKDIEKMIDRKLQRLEIRIGG